MKLIVAIVRPEKLRAVQAAIRASEASLISVSQVLDDGQDPGFTEIYRGREIQVPRPKLRLEIAVNDSYVDAAVGAIVRAGCTDKAGQLGDGKVLVTQLDGCVPIRCLSGSHG